jgi:hypothetical protein
MGVFVFGEFGKNLACLSRQSAASADPRFEFQKRSQLFIRTHNETLSVVAVCVSNPDCSSAGINRYDTALTPTGFAEIHPTDQPGLRAFADSTFHKPACRQW